MQYTTLACKFKGKVTKVGNVQFSAYGGVKGSVVDKDTFNNRITVQGIDTVLLPGNDNRESCLKGSPLP